ncbi:MAG: hypothetical protein H7Y88_13365 [Phycisphaerales bacterium]|nr:hypothetical protein [Phycisphaerales bacterium]
MDTKHMWISLIDRILAGTALLVGSYSGWVALSGGREPAWFLLVFGVVVVASGLISFATSLSLERPPEPLGLACIGGTIAVSGLLGYVSARGSVAHANVVFGATESIGLGYGGLAAAASLVSGGRGAVGDLTKGVIALGVLMGLALAAWRFMGSIKALPDIARLSVGAVGFVIATALLAAGVHLLVQAFTPVRTGTQQRRDAA